MKRCDSTGDREGGREREGEREREREGRRERERGGEGEGGYIHVLAGAQSSHVYYTQANTTNKLQIS